MSVAEAYRRVRHTCNVYGTEQEVRAQLKDIARYLDTTDPIELGAALLLEQAGYERAHEQMSLLGVGERE